MTPDAARVARRKIDFEGSLTPRKCASMVQTDTATLYAIAPEQLHRMIREGQWETLAEAHWSRAVSPADPTKVMDRIVRLHGGTVFFMGRDGFYEVTAPDAWREYGYINPRGRVADTQVRGAEIEVGISSASRVAAKYVARHPNSLDGASTRTAAWKQTGDGTSVGLFIPLPESLASQFSDLGPEDNSPPHVTLLYVGAVPKSREGDFVSTVLSALSKEPGPIRATLREPDFFVHAEHDRRVWYSPVRFSRDVAELRDRVWLALEEAGFEVKHSFPLAFFPHVTLAYVPGAASKDPWVGPTPSGSWDIRSVAVWGLSKPVEAMLGTFRPQPSAVRVASCYVDQLPGGLGDLAVPGGFDASQLAQGVQVEMEHTNDPALAREIAMDHLTENHDYYRNLKQIETTHTASEVFVDERGYAHDDEGNTWFVGKQWGGETYTGTRRPWGPRPPSRPSSPATSVDPKKLEALDKLLAKHNDRFIRSLRDQVAAGRTLSDAQKKALRQNFYRTGLRELADLFR